MTKAILLGSAIVLMAATPSMAQSEKVETRTNIKTRGDTGAYVEYSSDAETITKKEVKRTVEKAQKSVKKAADKVASAAKETPKSAAPAAGLTVTEANIAQNNSAEHMIGKPVLNAAGDRVGSVHDVILTKNGQAKTLIVADGGMMSMGDKKAAFDYGVIKGRDDKGAVLTTITEEQINKAKAFSYDAPVKNANAKDKPADVQILGANETSAREVLSAKIVNEQNKTIGTVKDIAIENGQAQKLVVAYDQILGLGGKKVGLAYDQADLTKNDGGKLNLRLNQTQAAQLTQDKKAVN